MDRDWSFCSLVPAEVQHCRIKHLRACSAQTARCSPRGKLCLWGTLPSQLLVLLGLLSCSTLTERVAVVLETTANAFPLFFRPQFSVHDLFGIYGEEECLPLCLCLHRQVFMGFWSYYWGSCFFPLKKEPKRISYLTDTWMSSCFLAPSDSLGTASTSRTKTSSFFGGGVL